VFVVFCFQTLVVLLCMCLAAWLSLIEAWGHEDVYLVGWSCAWGLSFELIVSEHRMGRYRNYYTHFLFTFVWVYLMLLSVVL
jgi:hypothetical protein